MNYEKIIYIDGIDKTSDISAIYENNSDYSIYFYRSKKYYKYGFDRVRVVDAVHYDAKDKIIYIDNKRDDDVKEILFYDRKYRIKKDDVLPKLHDKDTLKIYENELSSDKSNNLFEYYKTIADKIGTIESEDEQKINILASEYESIERISSSTVLSSYFNKTNKEYDDQEKLIFPFGINESQLHAVENAFKSQVSIIQGPPGTGKTQTILNIIANIVLQGKTVAVVSNNNSAVLNVYEKLEKYGLNFIAAILGKKDNKKAFIDSQSGLCPEFKSWNIVDDEDKEEDVIKNYNELVKNLNYKNEIAKCSEQLMEYKKEYEHYCLNIDGNGLNEENYKSYSPDKLLSLINLKERITENEQFLNIFKKIYYYIKYGKKEYHELFSNECNINAYYGIYYKKKISTIENEISHYNSLLNKYDFDDKMADLSNDSMHLFKKYLIKKYGNRDNRIKFKITDLQSDSYSFLNEYPIVLSTTYSIKKSLNKNIEYDYLIIDESSQVDLSTGVLAFSCANNVIIVGDQKQLPNVIGREDMNSINEINCKYDIPLEYNYIIDEGPNSLLSSCLNVFKNCPTTMLKEHYRCNPKIINFCNRTYYDDQLIIMKEDDSTSDTIQLIETGTSIHATKRFNQRQIDVIKQEVIPKLKDSGITDIGIIAPYNRQVDELKKQIGKEAEIATIHKFQGREKQAIIISSVENDISKFVDDPNLLNVAVSRAIKSLTVLVSDINQDPSTNYGKLINYIKYNQQTIKKSDISSIFDLLYRGKNEERRKYLSQHKKVSDYDSENLIYSLIENIINDNNIDYLSIVNHYKLRDLIINDSCLCQEEINYINNGAHADFILFNKYSKEPVLAIEVDGLTYHNDASKQHQRDALKNSIFENVGIDLLRISTSSTNQKELIETKLKAV